MKRIVFTILFTIACAHPGHTAILVFNQNGTYVTKPTMEVARTASDVSGKTVVVTSVLSAAQSNITASWPIDRRIKIEKGGSIANTTAFTINAPFEAGLYQAFSGPGAVTFGPASVNEAYPEWFGAAVGGSIDCASAIRAAISSVGPSGGQVRLQTGKYLIKSTINIVWAVTIAGVSPTIRTATDYPYGTIILKDSTISGPALSADTDRVTMKSFGVVGISGNAGDGIHLNANGISLDSIKVAGMGNDGIRIGSYSTGTNANSCILNRVDTSYNAANGLYIHDGNGSLPNANACSITGLLTTNNTKNGVQLGNCYQNTFTAIVVEGNGAWGVQADPESRNNYFVGGDNTETNVSGQLWNRGTSNMFFLESESTNTEAGIYTISLSPKKAQLSGELRVTPYPSSQQGGANYISTQVMVDGFYGGSTGTGTVTNNTTYRLFTCSFPADGNFIQGTLYINYHIALGGVSTQRTIKAYAISATTNSIGLATSKITEITEYSDVDSVVTTNVPAITWAAGVMTVSNTNNRPDVAGQLFSWSFVGSHRGASKFSSITAP